MVVEATRSPLLLDRVRRDIVDGVYNPRERLVEVELAERYGVARSAMRAALLELTAEGLVERVPNRGARVRALTVTEGIEIAEVRKELEGLCARLAAERGTEAERARVAELIVEMHAAFVDRNMSRHLRANTAFHTQIHTMARHQTAARILAQLGNLSLSRHFPMAFGAPVRSASLAEHERVASAIAEGDPDAAERAMRDHLDGLIDVLRAQHPSRQDAQLPAV